MNLRHSSTGVGKKKRQIHSVSSKTIHKRGDKNVINGAKESLMSILAKFLCNCEKKNNLKDLAYRFLRFNKSTASYDTIVWLFIFLMFYCSKDDYY